MKNKPEVLVALVTLLILSGCASSNNNSGSQNINWRTGTEGITMSFVADNPPSEVLSRSALPVIVKFSNKGAFDVTDLSFYIGGYDPTILPFAAKSQTSGIRMGGKNQYNTLGTEESFVQWTAPAINLNNLRGIDNFKQAISVTACYSYVTLANPTICIDSAKYDTVSPNKCTFDIKDLGSSQGAPIAVTSIKQKMSDQEIYLEIQVANSGKGTPFLPEVGNCMNLGYTDVNKVRLSKVAFSNGQTFTCNPEIIRLENNRGFAVCTGKLPSRSSFVQTPLLVQLYYKYRDSLPTREVTIVNVNK